MRFEEVDVDSLVPIEVSIYAVMVRVILNKFDSEEFKPIQVVEYGDKYLMGDGHHRASYAYVTQQPVQIMVLETDQEVLDHKEGYFLELESKDGFIQFYEEERRQVCSEEGILSIEDLVEKNEFARPLVWQGLIQKYFS